MRRGDWGPGKMKEPLASLWIRSSMALLNAETLGWTDYGVHSLLSKGRLHDISVDPSDRDAGFQQCELNKDTIPCLTYNVTFSRDHTQKNCIQQTNGNILAWRDSSFHITVKKIHNRNNLVHSFRVFSHCCPEGTHSSLIHSGRITRLEQLPSQWT